MFESSSRSWCKVENIGENVIFLGLNTSITITSGDLPPYEYSKGNNIYFTDDNLDEHEVGVSGEATRSQAWSTPFVEKITLYIEVKYYVLEVYITYIEHPVSIIFFTSFKFKHSQKNSSFGHWLVFVEVMILVSMTWI